MSHWVFFVVLVGALAHASWNTLVKRSAGASGGRTDPFGAMILTGAAAGSLASVVLMIYGLPHHDSLIFMAGSIALQLPYYWFLSRAYETGEFSQVYPITRGTAGLLAVLVSPALTGDNLPESAWYGLTLVCGGVLAIALAGGRSISTVNRTALGYALLAAMTICAYSIFGGLGVRLSGNPIGFSALHFVTEAVVMCSIGLLMRGRALFRDADLSWRGAPGSGLLSFISYTIVLWAMSVAPVALVSVLRETSVLMAVMLGVLVLKERLLPARIMAAVAVISGLAIIRLG
jgi:drug/metabolite transporter (DMT)-like permease